MSVVAKFGGSSVRDAEAFKRCGNIIAQNPDIKVVVVSATYNTTNDLEMIAGLAVRDEVGAKLSLEVLFQRHLDIATELNLDEMTITFIDAIKKDALKVISRLNQDKKIELSHMDEMYSFGERLSSTLLTSFLSQLLSDRDVDFFDVRKVLETDDQFGFATPNIEAIKKNIGELELVTSVKLAVTQGFIGATEDGRTTTLGREGSDYSATLLAEALGASEVQIWTDVPGISTVDPKQIKDAKVIKEMTYEEAALMASNGAKVLFPKTLAPAKRASIPVYVKSSYLPNEVGTKICNSSNVTSRVTGLTINNDYLAIIGVQLEQEEGRLTEFFSDFHIKHLKKEEGCFKYVFKNPSELHVALYSLHGFIFSK